MKENKVKNKNRRDEIQTPKIRGRIFLYVRRNIEHKNPVALQSFYTFYCVLERSKNFLENE